MSKDSIYKPNKSEAFGIPLSGMNRYFVASSGVDIAVSAMRGTSSYMQNAWDDSPTKFEELGAGTAEVIKGGGMLAMSAAMAAQHLRTLGTDEGYYIPDKGTLGKLKTGGWQKVGDTAGKTFLDDEMKVLMKNKGAFKVNIRGGAEYSKAKSLFSTYKPMGWRGIGLMAALQFGVDIGSKVLLGFAGRALDQAYNEQRHFMKPYYDNRFFNTQEYDRSSYQQLGMAMDNYENRMMSVARIYHAR